MKHDQAPPALYVGRFQPFHLGHLDALNQIFFKEDFVIIAIGSAEENGTTENPFTAGERYEMITSAIMGKRLGKRKITGGDFAVIPVRDVRNNTRWVKHVETLLPRFGRVYTGSLPVKKLFEKSGRHKVFPVQLRLKINATEIRQRMNTNQPWKHMVPKSVASYIAKKQLLRGM